MKFSGSKIGLSPVWASSILVWNDVDTPVKPSKTSGIIVVKSKVAKPSLSGSQALICWTSWFIAGFSNTLIINDVVLVQPVVASTILTKSCSVALVLV